MARLATLAGTLVLGTLPAGAAAAQRPPLRVGGQAVAIATAMRPTPERATVREAYLTQPILAAVLAPIPGLAALLTLNAEWLTLDRGELTAGAWGEGFVDRRHPHTAVHELLVSGAVRGRCGGARCGAGAFAGKGFVPFGSDDPMSRPFAAYPVNHHLAQILERAVAGLQLEAGPLALEGALFNGDEPERPWQWPRLARFGDSWALRGTLRPAAGVEVTASRAEVASPESRPGTGPAQDKWHLGVRGERRAGRLELYGLAEWARTSELEGRFRFDTWLVEAAAARGAHRLAWRGERTDRPEEERLSPYRTLRPHLDNHLVGITRWTLHTLSYRFRAERGGAAAEPFVEATVGSVREIGGGLFNVAATYGSAAVRRLSLGVRVSWSLSGHRMGRYGLAAEPGEHGTH